MAEPRVVIGRDSYRKAKGTGAGRDLESKPEYGQGRMVCIGPRRGQEAIWDPCSLGIECLWVFLHLIRLCPHWDETVPS